MVDEPVDDRGGQARHLGQQPVAARRERGVEGVFVADAHRLGDRAELDERGGVDGGKRLEHQLDAARSPAGGEVVANDELALGIDAGDQLLELEVEQAALDSELEHVRVDLAGDPSHHLEPLGHGGDVAHGDEVLDLQGGQGVGDLVEAVAVALERGDGLVGAADDRAGVLEHVAGLVEVEGDDVHRGRHRDDGHPGLPGDTVGRAVAGAGLLGRDRRVGHEVDAGLEDAADVLVEDDRAVHLGQLAQAGGRERHVERETTGGHGFDLAVLADDDQRTGASAQDAFETLTQGHAGRDGRQRRPEVGRCRHGAPGRRDERSLSV